MFSNEQHRGSFDDERRRLAGVLAGATVYRPLHSPLQSPPTNGVTSQPDNDVTSGSRDELAPPPAKVPRDYVDHLAPSTTTGEINPLQVSSQVHEWLAMHERSHDRDLVQFAEKFVSSK